MQFRLSVITIINRLLILLVASAFLGWLVGHIFLAIFLTAALVVIWHYHHLFKLVNWLWQSKALSPPQATGLWGNLYDGLYRQVQQYRTKHKQANEKIRRFRDGAEALPDAVLMLSDELTINGATKKPNTFLGCVGHMT
jgi:two-component system phosphate regulon sensor histidine kinase PhoR